jgi:hypothetical protein
MNTVTEIPDAIPHTPAGEVGPKRVRRGFPYRIGLITLFVLSLPIVNPWVRGDGVGYYAFARAILVSRDLSFEPDWLAANPSFRQGRMDASGHILATQYTRTGHLDNHFTVGPAILWGPFLFVAHTAVLLADRVGAHIPANGFSRPYVWTMALATAAYGFAGLLLAFDLARRYGEERWAFLATLGIWFASSLPVYMYFNPSWSHALSAFTVALFLWYWHRTRQRRSVAQWCVLAAAAGLMVNVYYPNAVLLLVPGVEAIAAYLRVAVSGENAARKRRTLLGSHALFLSLTLLLLAPTFLTRWIIYGSAFTTGYPAVRTWAWGSPALGAVLFSADHGMLSWTPILAPAIVGLALLCRRDRLFGSGLILSFAAFYYLIASYPDWDGLSSFGNRFFVSLTPVFVIGLAMVFDGFARVWRRRGNDFAIAAGVVMVLVLWNLGFIFQWGTQMIPARGPISWAEMAHNQFAVVPGRITQELDAYFLHRRTLMREIEEQDMKHLQGEN